MRSSYFKVALALGVLGLVGSGLPACGSSSSGGSSGSGGSTGGTGGSAGSATGGSAGSATGGSAGSATGGSAGADGGLTKTCGTATCSGASILSGAVTVQPCCPSGTQNTCGLDTSPLSAVGISFTPACQAKHQPGNLDSSCPDVVIPVPQFNTSVTLPGCCRADTSTCGGVADTVSAAGISVTLGMGCVDSSPFLEGGAPKGCTPGVMADAGTE